VSPGAYYNEIDPVAAQWLRNLIQAGHIAPGDVDERSILDVCPDDLIGYRQCHFFAGVGVWSYALRAAGWPDDREVWTASCPCQPFSVAGVGSGFDDERHLWPFFFHLAEQRSPARIYGEQVASKDANPWLDLVQTDLESVGYAFGAVAFPSAGVGAPHIRDRTYWVANNNNKGLERLDGHGNDGRESGRLGAQSDGPARASGGPLRLADADGRGWAEGRAGAEGSVSDTGGAPCWMGDTRLNDDASEVETSYLGAPEANRPADIAGGPDISFSGMADAEVAGRGERGADIGGGAERSAPEGLEQRPGDVCVLGAGRPGPTNGLWSSADWLGCTDGKWRPVEPRPQPLVDGSAESLGRVRSDALEEIEKEINEATAQSEGGRAAAMRNLLDYLGAEAERCWPSGRLPGLHEAPFLLAFVRQLQEQGWRIAEGLALPRPEAFRAELRVLRVSEPTPGAPHQHGLAGQQPGEHTDSVHFLSSLLARHAHTAWGHAYSTYAEIGFPLAHGARSRVGRLRAYGNAINAEAARIFIECTLEGG
jgi:site-specific DNA-cytosine methylase